MKKILLIFSGVFLISLVLSGCSNKYNNYPLHTEKYYTKHIKQRNLILKKCGKLTPFELSKHSNSNLAKDCQNASNSHQNSQTPYRIPPGPPSSINLLNRR